MRKNEVNSMSLDLHRHDEHSTFDGFGKATELAKLAKEKGYTALGLSNHGNLSGLVQHHFACKEQGIKPVLGVEAYFQPVFNKEQGRNHLCLFAKNLVGYQNLNKVMYAAEQQKYYRPIVTFKDLEECSEGIIATSACMAGYISKCIEKKNIKLAEKAVQKFKKIFGEDFYIEIQPYKIDDEETQEEVNRTLIEIAKKYNVKLIFTSDSHYGSKEDFDTYLKMHQIGNTKYDVVRAYGERYMPDLKELGQRFIKQHSKDYGRDGAIRLVKEMYANLNEIEEKIEEDILGQIELKLPEYVEGKDSYDVLLQMVKDGLATRGKTSKKYIDRCKEELSIIKMHGYSDYFLIVADYIQWAKDNGIMVGPGRGSVCNCQVAWAIGITEVDSLKFNLDFRRFLREDKKKLPDIDLDFETARRHEVLNYIVNKYKGHSAQICSYGNYMVDNLINDLAKVCGLEDAQEIANLKKFIKKNAPENSFDYSRIEHTNECKYFNKNYDNIVKHFSKMFKKVRYLGTHAAGVAVTGGNILDYCGLRILSKDGSISTVYNLADLENINVVKFDVLGLSTMGQVGELRRLTGKTIDDSWYEDEKIYENFRNGNTDGVFQFESNTAKQILQDIECDCFEDVIAGSSMNRPGPLALGMPQQYANNKRDGVKKDKFYEYTKETYGTIVYQEQLQQICINIGGMTWPEADKVMKCLKNVGVEAVKIQVEKDKKELTEIFVKGALKNGFTEREAREMFEKVLVYTFNKGHGAGYSIISLEEMFYKVYYPNEFWYVKLKHAGKEADVAKYSAKAVKDGSILFLPHVNYSADYALRKVDGENIIQLGLRSIKGVGEKAADFIEAERKANGNYTDIDDFIDRCKVKGSPVNKGVISKLEETGALVFDKKTYLKRVTKYNSTLYMKSLNQ